MFFLLELKLKPLVSSKYDVCYRLLHWTYCLEDNVALIANVITFKQKVKQSHSRPGQAQRVAGVWGSQISRQSAHENGKVVSPTHRPPLFQEIFLVLISVRDWVNLRAIVRPEGLCQWIRITPSGRDPATFRLVAQFLNQLCYRVPLITFNSQLNNTTVTNLSYKRVKVGVIDVLQFYRLQTHRNTVESFRQSQLWVSDLCTLVLSPNTGEEILVNAVHV